MSDTRNEKAIIFLLALPLATGLALVSILWEAWVLVRLWGWYMVPIFHLPLLVISQAIGVICVAHALRSVYVPSKDGARYGAITYAFVTPTMLLTIGWLAK